MCYKYATPTLFELLDYLALQPKYEIKDYLEYYLVDGFDKPFMAITTNEEPNIIQPARWGLMAPWIKTTDAVKNAPNTLNARNDTIFELATYKNVIGKNRCLVWTNGFFEPHWNDEKGKSKTPYFVYLDNKQPFTFGGIWNTWVDPETGEIIKTFSVITTEPNTLLAEVHNNGQRMPLIIAPEDRAKWLGELDKEGIVSLMKPYPDGPLKAHPVSKIVDLKGYDKNIPEIQDAV